MSNNQKGYLFVLVSQIIWGITPSILKTIDYSVPTTIIVFLRFIIASIFLFFLILSNSQHRKTLFSLSKKSIYKIMLLGLIASGIADLLLTQGIRYSGAIIALLVSRLEIPITVIMSVFFLKEKINKKIIFATIASTLGIIFIAIKDANVTVSSSFYLGIALAGMGALLWAYATILAKNILSETKVPSIIVTFIRITTGVVITLCITFITRIPIQESISHISNTDWIRIGYVGIMSSAIGFYTFYKGLELLPANKTSILLSVSIAVNILAGIYIGEILSVYQWLGVGSIVTAVIILTIKPAQKG